ncbi:hypothetical protein Agub_g2300 [Astrephomene gubernaculifera]|uniref:Uncharacterized protein n=1 Tax=Astrephomene gubernaculifera TaxID=47775 RepID=A0AAD3DGV1_9CHLO|nr:hypothetical protein Agub_g2300 [Astrephomene gubernaculifera]
MLLVIRAMQQAVKWRWISPRGLVAFVASPSSRQPECCKLTASKQPRSAPRVAVYSTTVDVAVFDRPTTHASSKRPKAYKLHDATCGNVDGRSEGLAAAASLLPTNQLNQTSNLNIKTSSYNANTNVRMPLLRTPPSAEAVRRVTAAAAATNNSSAYGVTSTFGYPSAIADTTTTAASGTFAAVATATITTAATVAEVPPALLPTRHIIAAVDPDLKGAIAVLYWDEEAGDSSNAFYPITAPPVAVPASASAAPEADQGLGEAQEEDELDNQDLPLDADQEAIVGGHDGDDEGTGPQLWLPAPPPPPADRSRWKVHVWDMPISAAERQKRTASGQVSRRRLVHVAGARAVLARALSCALPPLGEARRVALYGYVEVPPILPGDGNLAVYASLWSTGVWLGLMAGMGFTVGSTPVRRWKTDMGLFGARSKDASLLLARSLFPEQEAILRHKKNHGRADALLIAAWALGAGLPRSLANTLRRNGWTLDELMSRHPEVAGLEWGMPRPPAPTDAYGNLLTPEQDMMDEIEAAEAKVDRKAQERSSKTTTTARRRKKATADDSSNEKGSGSSEQAAAGGEQELAPPLRRKGKTKKAAAAVAAAEEGEGPGKRRTEEEGERDGETQAAVAHETAAVGEEGVGGVQKEEKKRSRGRPRREAGAKAAAAAVGGTDSAVVVDREGKEEEGAVTGAGEVEKGSRRRGRKKKQQGGEE